MLHKKVKKKHKKKYIRVFNGRSLDGQSLRSFDGLGRSLRSLDGRFAGRLG